MKKVLLSIVLFIFCLTNQSFAQSDNGWSVKAGAGVLPNNGKVICGIDAVYEYHFGNGLHLGAGTAVIVNPVYLKSNKTRIEIPVFGEIRYCFLKGNTVSPFLGAELGILGDFTDHGTGYIAKPLIGLEIKRFEVSCGFTKLSATYDEIGKINNETSLVGGRYENSGASLHMRYRF